MYKESDFDKQFDRLKKVTGCKTQTKLASFFDTTQSSISSICRKRRIPANVFLKLIEKIRANPQWIKTGKGQKMYYLTLPESTPDEVAQVVMKNPKLLSLIPSAVLLKELLQRSDEIQRDYESRIGA